MTKKLERRRMKERIMGKDGDNIGTERRRGKEKTVGHHNRDKIGTERRRGKRSRTRMERTQGIKEMTKQKNEQDN